MNPGYSARQAKILPLDHPVGLKTKAGALNMCKENPEDLSFFFALSFEADINFGVMLPVKLFKCHMVTLSETVFPWRHHLSH